jgi:DNA-binding response OmpR family regulator
MTEVLTEEGYRVTVSPTATGAIPHIQTDGIDLIIADLDRGVYSDVLWNGIEQLRQTSPTTPIIVCTGHSEAGKVELTQHNVSTIIMKPFDIDDLLAQVSHFTTSN